MALGALLFFIFGISIGSFLNVLIYRIPKNENILGRSYCDFCKKKLPWYDLVPIISFLSLHGKCRFCKKEIDHFIPFVELITALLFAAVYLKLPIITDYNLWFYLYFISVLIIVFFTDLRSEIIPDKVVLPALLVSIIFAVFSGNPINHILSGLGAFIFFLILALATKGRGMGGGDIKLSMLLGVILGFPSILISLYLAFLTGGIISLILILWKKKRFKGDTIPFGPFLALFGIISLFFGNQMVLLLLSFL